MKNQISSFFISGMTYFFSFLLILCTWGFVDRFLNPNAFLSIPWIQWPFELMDWYFLYFANDLLGGNIRHFVYTTFVSSLISGILASRQPEKLWRIFAISFLIIVNMITASAIIEDPHDLFLNRKIAFYSVLIGVPFSFHFACSIAKRILARDENSMNRSELRDQ